MKITFETPTIIGALCEKEGEIPRGVKSGMKKLGKKVAFLPFVVERRHLKNTIACMKLMDIHSLFVCGRHRREIVRHLSSLDPNAKNSGEVDCVVRRGKRFVGFSIGKIQKSQKIVMKRGAGKSARSKVIVNQRLSSKTAMGHFCQTAVELLTCGLK